MLKITLDPGHGKNQNQGCVSGYYESNRVFLLAQYLKSELEQYDGVAVYLTKSSLEQNPDLESRGKTARDNGSSVFISLHTNAASSSAVGVVGFHSLKRPNSKALCEKLCSAAAGVMDTGVTYSRGSLTRAYPGYSNLDYYGVIRSAVKSSAVENAFIIEHGFHTNPKECAWLASDSNLKKIAKAEAETLTAHYGLKRKGGSVSGSVYTVKSGDNMSAIAKAHGVSLSGLLAANPQVKAPKYIIYAGDKITIPGESTEQGKAVAAMRVTAKDGLRLRKVPSTDNNSSILLVMPNGASVEILEYVNADWAKARYNGTTGYCSRVYLSSGSEQKSASILIGSKVKIKPGTKYTNGIAVPDSCIGKAYTVQQMNSDRVLLKEIYSWVPKSGVTLV